MPPRQVAEVGWFLQTDHAAFIWQEPRLVARSSSSGHAKSLAYCPAVIDHESRLFQVPCPFNLRLRVRLDDKGKPTLINVDGEQSSVNPRELAQMTQLAPRTQWRHPDRAPLQISTPYTFVADEPVYLTQLPPILHYRHQPWPGLVIGGRVPIHIWPRALMFAFEWYDLDQDLILTRGDPWFCCRFEVTDANRHVRLVEAELTPELQKYLAGTRGVVNYVNQTFSL